MSILKDLRAFANGEINESAINQDDDITEFENDPQFMQECMNLCLPTLLAMEMLGESTGEDIDQAITEAYVTLQDYLIGQGIISEAAAVPVTNPKINVVRLNKNAQINRLTTIITLKMARRDNIKAYQKYKLGQKIKKTNMAEMAKRYGAKANKLAKKLWAKTHKNGKVAAVVADKTPAPAKNDKK